MISVTTLKSASQATSYYAPDNYYTEHEAKESSEWYGKIAAELGLEGQIDKEQFKEVLEGKIEGQELGKWVQNEETGKMELDHRPGVDITFSAPKSFSIMTKVFGDEELAGAMDQAVKDTLDYVEKHYATTRMMIDGEVQRVETGKLLVGLFKHDTSRDLDPQDHQHAVLTNITKLPDGSYRSHTNDAIYRDQHLIGAYFNNRLAELVREAGHDINITDKYGNWELAGFSKEQLDHFSQRRSAINAWLEEKGINPESATAAQREMATLETRDKKIDVAHEELSGRWSERAAAVGLTPEAVQSLRDRAVERMATGQEVTKTPLEVGAEGRSVPMADKGPASASNGPHKPYEPGSKMSGVDAIHFAVSHLGEREGVFEKREVLAVAMRHGVGRVGVGEIMAGWDKLEKDGTLVRLPNLKSDPLWKENYTTKAYLAEERQLIHKIDSSQYASWKLMEKRPFEEKLSAMEARIGEQLGVSNFSYTRGQRQSLEQFITNHDRYTAVQGLAGVGKTTMTKALKAFAEDGGYTVRAMAPYGTQAKRLGEEAGLPKDNFGTIDSFLLQEKRRQTEMQKELAVNPYQFRKPEIWIVDEMSAADIHKTKRLMRLAEQADAKVLFMGDKMQTQSIGRGRAFEMAQEHGIRTGHMTEINRQKTDDLRAVVSTITGHSMNDGAGRLYHEQSQYVLRQYGKAFDKLDSLGLVKSDGSKDALGEMVDKYLSLPKEEKQVTLLVTPLNRDRAKGNELIRSGLVAQGVVEKESIRIQTLDSRDLTKAQLRDVRYLHDYDLIGFNRDYKSMGVKNGDVGEVVGRDVDRNVVMLRFQDGREMELAPHKHVAITAYKREELEVAVGDKLRVTAPNGELRTGESGYVSALTNKELVLTVGKGDAATDHKVELKDFNKLDYGYFTTVHSVQGSQDYRELFHIPTPDAKDEKELKAAVERMGKIFGSRSGYVVATRPTHEIEIYTDDKAAAKMMFMERQEKSSPLLNIEHGREVTYSRPAPGREQAAPGAGQGKEVV